MDPLARSKAQPLPGDLPAPVDDGGARHLPGLKVPSLSLPATGGDLVDISQWAEAGLVLYVFPKMGRPDVADPPGWHQIAGAYGCTQQSCAFRDRRSRFGELGYVVAGLSAQPLEEQSEAHERLHLGFPLLADPDRILEKELRLPTFSVAGITLYKRLTLVAHGGRITKVFYPVFPPDENAEEVLAWLYAQKA